MGAHYTHFLDAAEAEAIAKTNNENDEDGWTYTVVPYGKFVLIEVHDEEGYLLGGL